MISTPDTPSIAEWWSLVTTPIMPFSSPSTTYISHSGLLRSSGCEITAAANSASSSAPPGAGSAALRRW